MQPKKRPAVAVTGATGSVGGAVAGELGAAGVPLRLLVRDLTRAPVGAGDVVQVGYDDFEAAAAGLQGIDLLFMVSASESVDRLDQHRTFIDAAVAAGVRHVVYTSFLGAAPDAIFTLARDHFATEQHLRASGMAWTFLRDSFYLDFLPALADVHGVIRGPAADGQVGAVARVDVARSAAAVLRNPEPHAGQIYQLTGPQLVTLTDAARIITDVTGHPTTYQRETVEQAYVPRQHYRAPRWQVDAWVSTYTAIAAGELASVTDDVQQLTGVPPISLAELLRPS